MGNDGSEIQRPVSSSELAGPKPDFNFKFSEKTKLRLENPAEGVEVEEDTQPDSGIDTRFFEISLQRPTGIEFATDLSLRYVHTLLQARQRGL